jgi:sulfotransferase
MKAGFLGFCSGALAGYYAAITDKPICVEKGRGWMFSYDWLKQFHPDPKIIVCVRDLRAILASMEKLFRQNAHLRSPGDSGVTLNMVTIQARVVHWLNSLPVGFTLRRLMDAVERGNHRHFHVVRFEELTSDPGRVMAGIYGYLGEKPFEHDFNNIPQVTQEDDSQYPIYGDHKIRSQVAPVPEDYEKVLTKPICDAIRSDNLAYYETFYRNKK